MRRNVVRLRNRKYAVVFAGGLSDGISLLPTSGRWWREFCRRVGRGVFSCSGPSLHEVLEDAAERSAPEFCGGVCMPRFVNRKPGVVEVEYLYDAAHKRALAPIRMEIPLMVLVDEMLDREATPEQLRAWVPALRRVMQEMENLAAAIEAEKEACEGSPSE